MNYHIEYGIKCVKNSIVIRFENSISCKHYYTEILRLEKNGNSGKYEVVHLDRYSRTSSKMINRVLAFYGIDDPEITNRKYYDIDDPSL